MTKQGLVSVCTRERPATMNEDKDGLVRYTELGEDFEKSHMTLLEGKFTVVE